MQNYTFLKYRENTLYSNKFYIQQSLSYQTAAAILFCFFTLGRKCLPNLFSRSFHTSPQILEPQVSSLSILKCQVAISVVSSRQTTTSSSVTTFFAHCSLLLIEAFELLIPYRSDSRLLFSKCFCYWFEPKPLVLRQLLTSSRFFTG